MIPSTGGIGLGLTIARGVARSHGGDVRRETSRYGCLRARPSPIVIAGGPFSPPALTRGSRLATKKNSGARRQTKIDFIPE